LTNGAFFYGKQWILMVEGSKLIDSSLTVGLT